MTSIFARKRILPCISVLLLSLAGNAGWADAAGTGDAGVTPRQVYQEAQQLRAEVERIRRYLGVRSPRARSYRLEDAVPRQNFYQAQTLFRKCNQLAQEIAGVSREHPTPAPDRELTSADVLSMLQAARGQLAHVNQELGIEEALAPPKPERNRNASDVMREIIEAGYTLNELVREGADWPDIYDRVLQMVFYTAGVLPEGQRYPALPPYECCKMPEDVYQSLVQSLADLERVADSVDFPLVRIIIKKRAEGGAGVDTVYDLTTVMVSDLAEITLRLAADDSIDLPDYPRPKRILPSHVYLVAQVLQRQIGAMPVAQ